MNRIGVVLGLALTSTAALAMVPSPAVPVPGLDDLGLVGLTVVIALVGAIAVRRRNKK